MRDTAEGFLFTGRIMEAIFPSESHTEGKMMAVLETLVASLKN